jgi:two-component system, OmpR family, response regulator
MPPRYRLLVADDDQALRAALERALRFEGYAVALAADGDEVISQVRAHPPDLVVLDLAMPGTGGVEACRRLRAEGSHVPVLMLTARDGVSARVAGLDAGADDYLVKPFAFSELLARLRALARRAPSERPTELRVGELRLDPATHRAWREESELDLTAKEFVLLEVFMRHPGEVLSRVQLLDAAWDIAFESHSNVVDVYVRYLREKIDRPFGRHSIETVRGVGYRLSKE